jgi:hypothetical protein
LSSPDAINLRNETEDRMTTRIIRPVRLFLAALVLQILAWSYYGSPYHQALFRVLTFTLVADGLWMLGRMIADGETPLPAMPAYLWVVRFLAIVTLIYGFLDGARIAHVLIPGHF